MPITAGSTARADDFISESQRNGTPSVDVGRVSKLEDDAMIHPVFLGDQLLTDGTDGNLTVTSGATNIDLAGARVVVRNYKDISITGTGQITFSNPHANVTTIIFLCRKFTCTSSASPAINAQGMGGAGGAGVSTSANNNGGVAGTAGTVGIGLSTFRTNLAALPTALPAYSDLLKTFFNGLLGFMVPGAGGSGGGCRTFNNGGNLVTGGTGGRGGGALAILCSGEWNFTTTISVAGVNGTNSSSAGAEHMVGGGGGGGGGYFLGLYRRLIANSGTVTVTGGTGGTGAESGATGDSNRGGNAGSSTENAGQANSGASGRNGGAGGNGKTAVGKNTLII
jgi:hypothetical protein